MSKFVPSPEQQAIFDYVESHKNDSGRKSIAVKARAGTGKTTTILEMIRRNPDIKGVYVAFNKDIVTEVQPLLESTSVQAKTFHGLSLGSLIKHIKKTYKIYPPDNGMVQEGKYRTIIQQHITPEIEIAFADAAEGWEDVTPADVHKMWVKRFDQLIHYLRVQLVEWDDRDKIDWLIHDYALQDAELSDELMDEMVRLTPKVMQDGEQQLTTDFIMDFDDMIYWVVKWDIRVWANKWVFVDEAQDLSPMQRAMVNKILYHKDGFIVIVGDDRQAIYRFAGADSDSFQRTVNWFKADTLPMTTTRRCDKIITHHAQQLVGDFVTLESKDRGKIVWLDESEFADHAKPGDMVICRVKAPLIGKAIEMLKKDIPAVILGGNIGSALVDLMEKISEHDKFTWDDPLKGVEGYRWARVQYWLGRDEEAMADSVHDDCEALTALIENSEPKSLEDFERYVNNLFSDTSRGEVVTLCTGHKAKGLQADRVFLLAPDKMPLNYLGMHPEDTQQEKNLYYVAMTRAKHTLVYLTNKKFLEPYEEGAKVRPTYIQYDFEDHEWTDDLLVLKSDAPEDYEPQGIAGLLTDGQEEAEFEPITVEAPVEDDIVEAEIIEEEPAAATEPVVTSIYSIEDYADYEPLDERLATAHAFLKGCVKYLIMAFDAIDEEQVRTNLERAEQRGKDFEVELSRTQVQFSYDEKKQVFGEQAAQKIQWGNIRSLTYNLLIDEGSHTHVLDRAIDVLKAMSKPADAEIVAAIEEQPLSAAEAADIGFAPTDTADEVSDDASITNVQFKVRLNPEKPHDDGAHHRAVMLARALKSHGLWDGETPIRFDDAYEMHNRVYGPEKMLMNELVMEEKEGEIYVKLPEENATDQPIEETTVTDATPKPTTPPDDDPRAWAQWMLDNKDQAVILDTETTDLLDWRNPKQKIEMVQIAIIDLNGNTLMKEYIRPMRAELKPGAAAVHGITEQVLDDNNALSFVFHADSIRDTIAGKHVIAYNSDFDANVLLRVYNLFDKEAPQVASWNCAMKMYCKHNPNKIHRGRKGGWWKLTEAIEQQRLTVDENAHDALADVLMTLELIKSMANDPDHRWANTLGVIPGDIVRVKSSGKMMKVISTGEDGKVKALDTESSWRNSFDANLIELAEDTEQDEQPEAIEPSDETPTVEPITSAVSPTSDTTTAATVDDEKPTNTISDPHKRIDALIRSFESPDKAQEFIELLQDVVDTWRAETQPSQ